MPNYIDRLPMTGYLAKTPRGMWAIPRERLLYRDIKQARRASAGGTVYKITLSVRNAVEEEVEDAGVGS